MLGITLKQMRYIEAAGRLGSIASAADELNISQSSISMAIDSLEAELDYDVFVRMPAKGVSTTPAGRSVIQALQGFLSQFEHLESELRSIGGDLTGTIRIACFVTAVGSFLPPILKQFMKTYPGVRVVLLEETMEGVVDLLDEGKADMAFTYEDIVGPGHEFDPLVEVPPYALVSRTDALAKRKSVSLADLAERPMALFDLPRTTGYYLRLITDAGYDINVSHKTASVEMVRTLVANGFGFSILSARSPEYVDGVSEYKALPIREKLPPRVFGILQRSGIRQPESVTAFLKLCDRLKSERVFEAMVVK